MILEKFKNKNCYLICDADLDGVVSRIVYEQEVEHIVKSSIILNTPNRNMEDFSYEEAEKSDLIVFVDIAPNPKLVEWLKEKNKEFLIFDHHPEGENGYDVLKDIVNPNHYFFTTDKCGCKIFFDEVTKNIRKNKVLFQLVELTDNYDRWQEQSSLWKDAKDLQNVMYGYVNWSLNLPPTVKYNEFIKFQHEKIKNSRYFYFTKNELSLIAKAKEKERSALKTAKENLKIRIDGNNNFYGYFECNSKLSYVANQILKEMDKLKYIVCHSTYEDKNGLVPKVSIRSIDNRNFNCAELAKKWGGGGHVLSSGVIFEDLSFFMKLRVGSVHLV